MHGKIFKIHPLTVEDWTTPQSRVKAQVFPEYFAFAAIEIRFEEGSNILKPFVLDIVVKNTIIITVHDYPIIAIEEVIENLIS